MKLIPKPTILPIFHLRYRSGWPLGSLLCHVGPNLRQKSLLYAIWAMLGFSPHRVPWSIYIHSFSCFPVLISTYRWNDMHSRVALTISYLPQASYLFKSKWYWHIREHIVFSPQWKTISTHRYVNETYPEANHSTYLSFEIPLRVALRLVIVPRGPEPTSKVTFVCHMGNFGFQPP